MADRLLRLPWFRKTHHSKRRKGKNFTAKTQRAQREVKTKKTRGEIEQIVELVADAMLEVNRALGRRAAGIGFVSSFALLASLR
jgi:hypothetical protein